MILNFSVNIIDRLSYVTVNSIETSGLGINKSCCEKLLKELKVLKEIEF